MSFDSPVLWSVAACVVVFGELGSVRERRRKRDMATAHRDYLAALDRLGEDAENADLRSDALRAGLWFAMVRRYGADPTRADRIAVENDIAEATRSR